MSVGGASIGGRGPRPGDGGAGGGFRGVAPPDQHWPEAIGAQGGVAPPDQQGGGMKFQVEHDALAEAVAWVARALPSRPVVPVLSGLRLDAGDGLTLSCFDYDLAATARVAADVAEPGTALVPGRLLAEIIRSLPGQPAEFTADGDVVSLTCGSAEFALVSLPLADYPELPPTPP